MKAVTRGHGKKAKENQRAQRERRLHLRSLGLMFATRLRAIQDLGR
jgi:hypothetical protein